MSPFTYHLTLGNRTKSLRFSFFYVQRRQQLCSCSGHKLVCGGDIPNWTWCEEGGLSFPLKTMLNSPSARSTETTCGWHHQQTGSIGKKLFWTCIRTQQVGVQKSRGCSHLTTPGWSLPEDLWRSPGSSWKQGLLRPHVLLGDNLYPNCDISTTTPISQILLVRMNKLFF